MHVSEPSASPFHGLDRLGAQRCDAAVVSKLRAAPEARFLVLAGERPAIQSNADRTQASLRWLGAAEIAALGLAIQDAVFLGVEASNGAGRFAVAAGESLADALRPVVDIRSLATQGVMTPADLATLATAKSLFAWIANTHHCGRCAAHMQSLDGGWKRGCVACGHEVFPRVDPVVVMLVVRGDACVLARSPQFRPGLFAPLAGFVEPGETLEEAVRRETAEEVGIKVGRVDYRTSQAWPQPHSLMLGCFAEAESERLSPAPGEIEAARWFTRADVAAMLRNRHAERLEVPDRAAIAHALLLDWLTPAG